MNNVPGSAHINYTLAGVTAIGGAMGYVKSRSLPSLVAGVGIGALYGMSGYLIQTGDASSGHMLGMVTSVGLTLAMGNRYRKTGAVMPAGAMTLLGAAGACYNTAKWSEYK